MRVVILFRKMTSIEVRASKIRGEDLVFACQGRRALVFLLFVVSFPKVTAWNKVRSGERSLYRTFQNNHLQLP